MDMTITMFGNKIETNLFEKPLALHLYIPPHSCHPPSGFGSLVTGMVLRIFRLCSRKKDIKHWLHEFYGHVLDRGFNSNSLLPVFDKAIKNAIAFTSRSEHSILQQRMRKKALSGRRIAFHLKYHPNDPTSQVIQKLFKDCIFEPPGKKRLNQLTNFEGEIIPTDGIVLAYSRPLNISNLLSYRKIHNRPGPKVSSYL